MMENEETFTWYLHQRGIDVTDAFRKYGIQVAERPEFILTFLQREYPEEHAAWKAKIRILGSETT